MSIKFLKLKISPSKGIFENISYLPKVVSLVERYRNLLFDDYFLDCNESVSDSLVSFIAKTMPYFWIITVNNGEMIGFVYLDDWTGSSTKRHSAAVTTCISPEYWGKFTKFAGKRFVKYVFKHYKLKKLRAQVYSTNTNAVALLKKLGFSYEATLKSETIVRSNPIDIDLYSIIKC